MGSIAPGSCSAARQGDWVAAAARGAPRHAAARRACTMLASHGSREGIFSSAYSSAHRRGVASGRHASSTAWRCGCRHVAGSPGFLEQQRALGDSAGRGGRAMAERPRALGTLDRQASNLPHQLSSFVGREREVARVSELLQGTGLLTLTGTGGAGKTRLALQAAAPPAEQFADGAWLVELAALTDARLASWCATLARRWRAWPWRRGGWRWRRHGRSVRRRSARASASGPGARMMRWGGRAFPRRPAAPGSCWWCRRRWCRPDAGTAHSGRRLPRRPCRAAPPSDRRAWQTA